MCRYTAFVIFRPLLVFTAASDASGSDCSNCKAKKHITRPCGFEYSPTRSAQESVRGVQLECNSRALIGQFSALASLWLLIISQVDYHSRRSFLFDFRAVSRLRLTWNFHRDKCRDERTLPLLKILAVWHGPYPAWHQACPLDIIIYLHSHSFLI